MTKEMEERAKTLDSEWKDEGNGYFSLRGTNARISLTLGLGTGALVYIAVPENHPAVGKGYTDFDPEVNGGLTFAKGNVFGWDYLHAFNSYDYAGDIRNALDYFRSLATKSATTPEVTVDA